MGSEEFTDKISILMGKRLLIKNLKRANSYPNFTFQMEIYKIKQKPS